MAQKQYTTYQADILSFELRDALIGVLNPGRYIGFNTISEYQAQVGSVLYIRFTQGAGSAAKYDKATPPVLDDAYGIVVTRQGVIIAEDANIDIPVTLDGGAGICYHVIYCQHNYIQVPGANNATYGVQSGSSGGGIPSVTDTRRAIIGIIKEEANAIDYNDITWIPYMPGIGDQLLYNKLFAGPQYFDYDEGAPPPGGIGIIGNRNFGTPTYITNYESLTDVLTDLDAAILARAADITTLGTTKLDDWTTPDDNTDLDATITRHGLLPKLSNDADEFLNGLGAWAVPPAGFIFRGSTSTYDYNIVTRGGNIVTTSNYELEMDLIIPAATDQVLLLIHQIGLWGAGNAAGNYGRIMFSKGPSSIDRVVVFGVPPLSATALNGSPSYQYKTDQIIVNLSSAQSIQIDWGHYSGAVIENWLFDLQITVLGWR